MGDKALPERLIELIQEDNRQEEEQEFQQWHAALISVPADYKRELKDGWIADIEIQPLRWMDLGLTLIESPKVMEYLQLAGGIQGGPLSSFLPYPVFQAGAEIFLKGMWLCQYDDCRQCHSARFVEPGRRDEVLDELKRKLGHDLLRIIDLLERVPSYQHDQALSEFLMAVSSLIRRDYFPVFSADRGNKWAFARYPKRFFMETDKEAAADSYNSYSPAPFVARLFREAQERLDELWQLRASLAKL